MSTALRDSSVALVRAEAALMDTLWQAVIGTMLTGEIVYWNGAAERLYGWRFDEVQGRSVLDVTPSAVSHERGERIMEALNQGRSWSGTFPVRSRKGTEFRVHVHDYPVLDRSGGLVGVVGVSTLAREVGPPTESESGDASR